MRFRVFVAVAVVASVVTLSAQKQTLTDQEKLAAVQMGVKEKGRLTGLPLLDGSGGAVFSLLVYTPTTWIAQQASDAAKRYLPFTVADITEDMLLPVLHVRVHPATPTMLTAAGMQQASSVDHVILRSADKQVVIQPLTEVPFEEVASSAMRDAVYTGMMATFPLDAVVALRTGKEEFAIVVIGKREKEFKVKAKHFERLP
jgi:hypothetical protein